MLRPFPLLTIALVSAAFPGMSLRAQTITGIAGVQSGSLTLISSHSPLLAPLDMVQAQAFPFNSTITIGEKPLRYPWKKDIVTTVFWVGEAPGGGNDTPNVGSSWDQNWMWHYGGVDDPEPSRRATGYRPAAFTPKLNPFYIALPYNDCYDNRATKAEAARVVPWFKTSFKRVGKSVCKDRWIAVRCGDRECYAQWSDCGPFSTEDAKYVFGNARPANSGNKGAALDVSPAVRDFLRLKSGAKCDWRFVELDEVPEGPWRVYGSNNPFSKSWNGGVEDKSAPPAHMAATMASIEARPLLKTRSLTLPNFKLKETSR